MFTHSLVRSLAVTLALALLVGCGQATTTAPTSMPTSAPPSTVAPAAPTAAPTATLTPEPTSTPVPPACKVGVAAEVQAALQAAGVSLPATLQQDGSECLVTLVGANEAELTLGLQVGEEVQNPLAYRQFAAVVPFHTLTDEITSQELRDAWQGVGEVALLVAKDTAPVLTAVWGAPADTVTVGAVTADALTESDAVGLVGFEQLDPTLKVLQVDGYNVLSNQFEPNGYPLGVALVASGTGELAEQLTDLTAAWANRDAEQLTQLVMTGVTAMCRLTAARMDEKGAAYPAEIVGPVLRQADITHVSNEVPFIEGCVTDIREGNLVFCSKYDYWAALEAIGTDIVGLSGNHVNDFGYDGALESLAYYQSLGVPVYGSGANVEQACEPLLWEDHGNTFAFIATLAYDPSSAWATEDLPGACYYYDNRDAILAQVSELSKQVDIVSVELQYLETYYPFPTAEQVVEFRDIRAAGADLVTGVQSHVPQAWEPYGNDDPQGSGMILYGLGNLFFDQMYSWSTRTGQIARHTIYQGRLLSTEVLTTVLEDYAQPRWATEEEREDILNSVNDAAPRLDTTSYLDRTGMAIYALECSLDHWLAGEFEDADYWGLTRLTDTAFADEPRGGQVTAAHWRVVQATPGEDEVQVTVAFSDVTCKLGSEAYTYPGPLYAQATVSTAGDFYQVGAIRPQTS